MRPDWWRGYRVAAVLGAVAVGVSAASLTARPASTRSDNPSVEPALTVITPALTKAHVRFLAHDLLRGRDTGDVGFELAREYVVAQFARIGLKPANGSSYLQEFDLLEVVADRGSELTVGDMRLRRARGALHAGMVNGSRDVGGGRRLRRIRARDPRPRRLRRRGRPRQSRIHADDAAAAVDCRSRPRPRRGCPHRDRTPQGGSSRHRADSRRSRATAGVGPRRSTAPVDGARRWQQHAISHRRLRNRTGSEVAARSVAVERGRAISTARGRCRPSRADPRAEAPEELEHRRHRSGRRPVRVATNQSCSRRISITSASCRRMRTATRSATARTTTPSARRRCWRAPKPWSGCSRRERWCSRPSAPRNADCSAPGTTSATR